MLKKIVIAGAAAAVVLGAGTAALAESGGGSSSTTAATQAKATPATAAAKKAASSKRAKRSPLRRALHATWVTKKGTSTVTHDAIRGSVTKVSATSITVKAADNVSQTYAITSATKVHSRAAGKGKTAPVSDVHTGDKVLVVGTGTSSLTATQLADVTK